VPSHLKASLNFQKGNKFQRDSLIALSTEFAILKDPSHRFAYRNVNNNRSIESIK